MRAILVAAIATALIWPTAASAKRCYTGSWNTLGVDQDSARDLVNRAGRIREKFNGLRMTSKVVTAQFARVIVKSRRLAKRARSTLQHTQSRWTQYARRCSGKDRKGALKNARMARNMLRTIADIMQSSEKDAKRMIKSAVKYDDLPSIQLLYRDVLNRRLPARIDSKPIAYYAAGRYRWKIATWLVRTARVSIQRPKGHMSLLRIAITRSRPDFALALLDRGVDLAERYTVGFRKNQTPRDDAEARVASREKRGANGRCNHGSICREELNSLRIIVAALRTRNAPKSPASVAKVAPSRRPVVATPGTAGVSSALPAGYPQLSNAHVHAHLKYPAAIVRSSHPILAQKGLTSRFNIERNALRGCLASSLRDVVRVEGTLSKSGKVKVGKTNLASSAGACIAGRLARWRISPVKAAGNNIDGQFTLLIQLRPLHTTAIPAQYLLAANKATAHDRQRLDGQIRQASSAIANCASAHAAGALGPGNHGLIISYNNKRRRTRWRLRVSDNATAPTSAAWNRPSYMKSGKLPSAARSKLKRCVDKATYPALSKAAKGAWNAFFTIHVSTTHKPESPAVANATKPAQDSTLVLAPPPPLTAKQVRQRKACIGGSHGACRDYARGWSKARAGRTESGDILAPLKGACTRYAEPCALLAVLYSRSKHDYHNFATATEYAEKGCARDSGESCRLAGEAHWMGGKGVTKNTTMAEILLSKSCTLKHPQGCEFFGAIQAKNNPPRALALYEKGCTLGGASSCFVAAKTYCTGAAGIPKDRGKCKARSNTAYLLARKGCRSGTGGQCGYAVKVADAAAKANLRVRPETKLRPLIDKGCRAGSAYACRRLGRLHASAKKWSQASSAYMKSCSWGDASGCSLWAGALKHEKNYPQAAEAYVRACGGGVAGACNWAGWLYGGHSGVSADRNKEEQAYRYGCELLKDGGSCANFAHMRCVKRKSCGKAVREIAAKAVKLAPKSLFAAYTQGKVSCKARDKSAATRQFATACTLGEEKACQTTCLSSGSWVVIAKSSTPKPPVGKSKCDEVMCLVAPGRACCKKHKKSSSSTSARTIPAAKSTSRGERRWTQPDGTRYHIAVTAFAGGKLGNPGAISKSLEYYGQATANEWTKCFGVNKAKDASRSIYGLVADDGGVRVVGHTPRRRTKFGRCAKRLFNRWNAPVPRAGGIEVQATFRVTARYSPTDKVNGASKVRLGPRPKNWLGGTPELLPRERPELEASIVSATSSIERCLNATVTSQLAPNKGYGLTLRWGRGAMKAWVTGPLGLYGPWKADRVRLQRAQGKLSITRAQTRKLAHCIRPELSRRLDRKFAGSTWSAYVPFAALPNTSK